MQNLIRVITEMGRGEGELPSSGDCGNYTHHIVFTCSLNANFLEQAFEWSVEASQLASRLKLEEEPSSPAVAKHLQQQVGRFLTVNDGDGVDDVPPEEKQKTSQADVRDLISQLKLLTSKLHDNPKLTQQCNVNIRPQIQTCLATLKLKTSNLRWSPRLSQFT